MIGDPTALMPSLLDPTADMRLNRLNSASMRIGPFHSSDVIFGRGIDASLRLRELIHSGDSGELSVFVDRYLSYIGVDLRLYGIERLPHRNILLEVLKASSKLEDGTETGARASIRIANVEMLLTKEVIKLPIDPSGLYPFVNSLRESAEELYERSRSYRHLEQIAKVNRAAIPYFTGEIDQSLARLEKLVVEEESEEGKRHIKVLMALALLESGKEDMAMGIIESLSGEKRDWKIERLMSLAGRLK